MTNGYRNLPGMREENQEYLIFSQDSLAEVRTKHLSKTSLECYLLLELP
jgi:hypothetical protein